MTHDLVSLVITIQPREDVTLPVYTGRSIYAVWMRWLESYDANLANKLHNAKGTKPYTCSDVVGAKRIGNELVVKAQQTVWFRVTGLNAEVSDVLLDPKYRPSKTINVDGKEFDVVKVTTDPQEHAWANKMSYQELSAPYLTAQEAPLRQFTLEFATPTLFKQNNLTQPFPLPDLVFGSLAERWEAFSNIEINANLRDYCREALGVSQYSLQSKLGMPKIGGLVSGSVGRACYNAVRCDRYCQIMITLLVNYAFYAGVGRYTTIGMGRLRQHR